MRLPGLVWLAGLLVTLGLVGAGTSQAQTGYEIGAGDVIQVTVLGQPTFSGDFTVDGEGLIAYPFLGRVKASAMSAPELERKLVTLLSDGYLRRPQVAVTVKQYRSQRVFVLGEVKAPGPYGLRGDRSLLTLLQDVGDLLPTVGHEVVIIRPPASATASPEPVAWGQEPPADDELSPSAASAEASSPTPPAHTGPALPGEVPGAEIYRINLRELRSGYADRDLQLKVGDTIYLPKAAQVYVTGHVAKPGTYPFEEGLTVFRLLAMAGSVTERGSEKGVRIVRLVDGKRRELKVKATDTLLPDDTLYVPERFF
jgi:polysaccharide export outer membrane protein